MTEYKFSEFNLENLKALREVIRIEDGREVSLDEALRRALEFYHKFVPYD
jgi:hypothetical protein